MHGESGLKPSNRILRLGPGTFIGILAALAVGAFSARQVPAASARYIETGATGKLQETDQPSVRPSPPRPPLKPEPAMLLGIQGLDLTPAQSRRLQRIDQQWQVRKAILLQGLERATPRLDPRKKLQMATLEGELGEFSELSRQFNRERDAAWRSCLAQLNPRQTTVVQKEVGP